MWEVCLGRTAQPGERVLVGGGQAEELEKEIDWWNHTLPSMRHMHQPATTQEMKDPYSLPTKQKEGT